MLTYILLTIEYVKRNLLSHMEYRINFIVESITMIINNLGLTAVWLLFFKQFETVNGWTLQDVILLHAITGMYYGIGATFAGGMHTVARKISNGELDFFLTLPKDVLWHILVSSMDPSVLGEILYGFLMFFLSGYTSFVHLAIFIMCGILGSIIFISIGVIYHSLSFFFGSAQDLSERVVWTIIGFTLYPHSIFQGGIKFLLYTIIPAGFIAGLPVELMKNFRITHFLVLCLVTFLFSLLARITFSWGLQKYESGNLIQVQG